MNEHLHWRRQFVVARAPLKRLSHWKHLIIGPLHLYGHPDLEINSASDSRRTIVLVGYLFDAMDTEKENPEILEEIAAHSHTLEEFILRIKPYAGRYAFIYQNDERCVVLQDALALREVYYCTTANLIVCGSQPSLIAHFAEPEIRTTNDPEIQDFYKNHFKNGKWVGDSTYYENVRHLLPNHYLEVEQLTAYRYWPTERIKTLDLEEAVERSCNFLEGIIRAAAFRYPLMIAVTSGTDSRTLLAASRGIVDKIHFFINRERDLHDRSSDIRVPKAMFAKLGLPFHVQEVPKAVDPEFKEIFLNNTFLASERILPTIYAYYKHHNNKLNILGIGEIGRTRYGKQPRLVSGYKMAYLLGYKDSSYAIKVCNHLLPEMLTAASRSGVNMLTLLYWEQMMGNWGAVGNSESDIAIEEFDPYNSHFLYETFLAVDDKYTTYTNNTLFREMIKRMWPELLQWPINPPADDIQDKVAFLLKKFRVYPILKQLKYQVSYARHLFAW